MESVFIMVVLIVLIACSTSLAEKYLKTRRLERETDLDDDVYHELDNLRGRVEVLEKIVTDKKYELSDEINRLERRA
ncbi:MAG: hypothetical protein O7C67_16540 [Gammaproteobacteria bacterium]|nr:hypothetical protein [Gammaproteobacteria bacterium]